MAQKVYFNYKESLTSANANRFLLGILEPGRYRGFDNMVVSGLNITLNHNTTGILQTKEDLSQSSRTSVIITKQGNIIQEDDVIALVVSTNASNAFIRRDLVVCNHQKVNVIGGQAATYSVIRGTDGDTNAPSLPNPNWQTIIGTIVIAPSASDLNSATWEPAKVPLLAGLPNLLDPNFSELTDTFAQLDAPNIFTQQQIIKPSNTAIESVVSSGLFTVPTNGNLFFGGTCTINEITANNVGYKTGLEITLMSSGGTITINFDATPTQGGYPIKSIGFDAAGYNSLTLVGYENITLKWMGTHWVVTSMSDTILRKLKIANDNIASHGVIIASHTTTLSELTTATAETNINTLAMVANTGTWTIGSGSGRVRYSKIGKRVLLDVLITNTNTSVASIASLKIQIPAGLTASAEATGSGFFYNSASSSYGSDFSLTDIGYCPITLSVNSTDGLNYIKFTAPFAKNFYCSGANNIMIKGQIWIDIP